MDEMTEDRGTQTRPHLSVSQVTMYLRCSMQYWFRYIQGVKAPPTLSIATGKAGHRGLEVDNLHKMENKVPARREDIVEYTAAAFEEETTDVPDLDPKQRDSSKDNLTALMSYYMTDVSPTTPIPTQVEAEFWWENPGTDPILGYIDLRDERGIFDYKVTSRAKTPADVDLSLQLSVYDAASGNSAPTLGLTALVPGGPRSEPKVITTTRSPALLTPESRVRATARARRIINGTAFAISQRIFVPVDDPRVCSWCGYRLACQGIPPQENEPT